MKLGKFNVAEGAFSIAILLGFFFVRNISAQIPYADSVGQVLHRFENQV
jgi:hypothetical protein